jgi:ABC-type sulfate transport system permease component
MLDNLLAASLIFCMTTLLLPFLAVGTKSPTLKWSSTLGRIQVCVFLIGTVTLTFFIPYFVAFSIVLFGMPFGITDNPEETKEFLNIIIDYQGVWMIFPATIVGVMFWKWYCKSQKT